MPRSKLCDALQHFSARENSTNTRISCWSSCRTTPQKWGELYKVGLDHSDRLRHSRFLRRELCVRLAKSAAQLQSLPHGWGDRDIFQDIITTHDSAIQVLEACHCPKTRDDDEDFSDMLDDICMDLKTVGSVPAMLHRLHELAAEDLEGATLPLQVNRVLLEFFTMRTAMRLLMQHYVESRQGRKFGFSGILQQNCSPVKVAQLAAEDSSALCLASLKHSPEIIVAGDASESLTYVPAVLKYMITEILKNACRAVVDRHASLGVGVVLPPVLCNISSSADGLVVKIIDEGCGMSRDQTERMWDFMYSTYKKSAWNDGKTSDGKWQPNVLAGYGVGLPLSRMYARYFGGSLEVSSVEGRGTEACIHLCRSPLCEEGLPSSCLLDLPLLDSAPNMTDQSSSSNGNLIVAGIA